MENPKQTSVTQFAYDVLKDKVKQLSSAYQQSGWTNDSTYYHDNVLPALYPDAKKFTLPNKNEPVGERIVDSGLDVNYDKAINVVDRLRNQPTRPMKYLSKYKF